MTTEIQVVATLFIALLLFGTAKTCNILDFAGNEKGKSTILFAVAMVSDIIFFFIIYYACRKLFKIHFSGINDV